MAGPVVGLVGFALLSIDLKERAPRERQIDSGESASGFRLPVEWAVAGCLKAFVPRAAKRTRQRPARLGPRRSQRR
jgi:hypothetical protein